MLSGEHHQPETSPTVHTLPLPFPLEKKEKLSKINAGKCEVRWELLLAAAAKNGCTAAGMSCGSKEEPPPACPCPVRAEAAQGAVLGPCKGLWSRCWRNHPACDCSRGLQMVSEQLGWEKSSFTTQ